MKLHVLTKTFVTKFVNPMLDVPTLRIPDWCSESCQKVVLVVRPVMPLLHTRSANENSFFFLKACAA